MEMEIIDLSDPEAPDFAAAAQQALDRVSDAVRRALGPDWRVTVQGDPRRASESTLADAVAYLATFRAAMETYRTQRDEAQDREAMWRGRVNEAEHQLQEVRHQLDVLLRPVAHYRDDPYLADGDSDNDEPPLGDDLAAEVIKLGIMLRDARAEAWAARHARVTVYLDGRLVHGPQLLPDAVETPPPDPDDVTTWPFDTDDEESTEPDPAATDRSR